MKRIFIVGMLTTSGLSFAFANTYSMVDSNDVIHTVTPIESIYGYDASYDLLAPGSLTASAPYTVTIANKSLSYTTPSVIQNANGTSITLTDGLGGSLSSPNTTTGDVSTNFTAPASGSVTLTTSGVLTGASCDAWGDGHCRIPSFGDSQSIPVSSASVNLNISGIFNSLLSLFHIIDNVEASQ